MNSGLNVVMEPRWRFAVILAMAVFDSASLWKRAVELRRVLSGITDRRAAEALEEHIARLEEEASQRDRRQVGSIGQAVGIAYQQRSIAQRQQRGNECSGHQVICRTGRGRGRGLNAGRRAGGRAVDCSGLENRRTCKRSGGSNPSLPAILISRND